MERQGGSPGRGRGRHDGEEAAAEGSGGGGRGRGGEGGRGRGVGRKGHQVSPLLSATPASPPILAPSSSKSVRPVARPGFGTAGEKMALRANHFHVKLPQNEIFHYEVIIRSIIQSKVLNMSIIGELVQKYGESHLGGRRPVYDRGKSLYTAGSLPFSSKEFGIEVKEEQRSRKFKVVIKLVGRADLARLHQFMVGSQLDEPKEAIHALDVVLRQSPYLNYVSASRSFFSPLLGDTFSIGDGVECWRGFYSSLRPTQMGLSLNIDISATSFYMPVMVTDFVSEYLNLNVQDQSGPFNDTELIRIKKALLGIKVQVTHRPEAVRRYRITGISSAPAKELMSSLNDEAAAKISVAQYFKKKYKLQLKLISWPCLLSGSDKTPVYLPMEVCRIVEGQRYTKKLNERQVKAMLRATCTRSKEREQSTAAMGAACSMDNENFLKEFGIVVGNKLFRIEGRVLPPPILKYHESGHEKQCQPSVGQWNMTYKRMINGGTVKYWACLNFSRCHNDPVGDFCRQLGSMCRQRGMSFEREPIIDTCSASPEKVKEVLVYIKNKTSAILKAQGEGKDLQLLILYCPEGVDYTIKRICETELGIVSQFCQSRHVLGIKNQYMENVSLKINVKVNGRNTVLLDAVTPRGIPFVTDRRTIIFGADVSHPAPGEDSTPSIVAVVASMDWPEATKYRSLVSAQAHRQEIIKDLFIPHQADRPVGGMIRDHLLAFFRKSGRKQARIIFYRDGVSESQFNEVLLHEMDAIRKFDFYLCSHAGIQGTSRPTHYHVLYDENGFSADALQTLTNNLCYTYVRCTRSVSVVPPAYYAHLAALRARYYVDGETSDDSSSCTVTRGTSAGLIVLPGVKETVQDVMFYC